MEMDIIELELKYCERCGGLWLRARGAYHVYCNRCEAAMEGPGAARKAKTRLRLPANTRLELVTREESPAACMEGGKA